MFKWVQILTLTGFLGWEITNQYYKNTYTLNSFQEIAVLYVHVILL